MNSGSLRLCGNAFASGLHFLYGACIVLLQHPLMEAALLGIFLGELAEPNPTKLLHTCSFITFFFS